MVGEEEEAETDTVAVPVDVEEEEDVPAEQGEPPVDSCSPLPLPPAAPSPRVPCLPRLMDPDDSVPRPVHEPPVESPPSPEREAKGHPCSLRRPVVRDCGGTGAVSRVGVETPEEIHRGVSLLSPRCRCPQAYRCEVSSRPVLSSRSVVGVPEPTQGVPFGVKERTFTCKSCGRAGRFWKDAVSPLVCVVAVTPCPGWVLPRLSSH